MLYPWVICIPSPVHSLKLIVCDGGWGCPHMDITGSPLPLFHGSGDLAGVVRLGWQVLKPITPSADSAF